MGQGVIVDPLADPWGQVAVVQELVVGSVVEELQVVLHWWLEAGHVVAPVEHVGVLVVHEVAPWQLDWVVV